MSDDIYLPPPDTTTAVFHYLSPCHGESRLDETFTVRGIRSGTALATWLKTLLSEHWCEQMDATIEIWTHDTGGNFVQSEVTHCPK